MVDIIINSIRWTQLSNNYENAIFIIDFHLFKIRVKIKFYKGCVGKMKDYEKLALDMAQKAYVDPEFKKRLLADPNKTITEETGQEFKEKITFHEASEKNLPFVLNKNVQMELDLDDLDSVSGGAYDPNIPTPGSIATVAGYMAAGPGWGIEDSVLSLQQIREARKKAREEAQKILNQEGPTIGDS